MTSPTAYIVFALTLTSAMISVIFFLAYKTLGEKPYALSWSVAFLAATCQWSINLMAPRFSSFEAYWLTVSAFALVVVTLGLRGHCQRTDCQRLPQNLWPYAALVFGAIVWTTIFRPHTGLRTAIVPGIAAITLFMSAAMVLRHRDKPRPAEWAAAITMILFGLVQFTAAGVAMLQGADGIDAYRDLYMHFNFLTLPAGYTGMAMFVIFMLASDLSEEMKSIAVRDQLTGLFNRRGFGEQAAIAYACARRTGNAISVIMSDIDRFKEVNDEFGHAMGDNALCHFANLLMAGRRTEDILARMGGEEFLLVLPGADLAAAIKIADDLCARVARTPMAAEGETLTITASFGVATISRKDTCLTDIIVRADKALYRSKRAGRNRVDLVSSQKLRNPDGTLKPISA
ncbi:MAG: GGDEF domain-containing protein [Gammaproteobacteria bacterium]|nr:GGDEF domain-containing protein [Gammaproteobacteria bacterium]